MCKRLITYILSLTLVLSSLLSVTGCGSSLHMLTKAEWIGTLAAFFNMEDCVDDMPVFSDVDKNNPYFNQIQACAEWDIIDKTSEFKPNDRATVEYAIITATKAIGLDKIAKSVDGSELKSDEEIVSYFTNRTENKYNNKSALYEETAKLLLTDLCEINEGLILEQYQEVEYLDNVYVVEEKDILFSMDGESATTSIVNLKEGDIVVVEPCFTYPSGKYAKITSIEEKSFKYVEPELEEIIDHVTMWGSFEPEVLGIIPMSEGVEVVSTNGEDELVPQVFKNSNGENEVIYVPTKTGGKTFDLGNFELKVEQTWTDKKLATCGVSGSVRLKNVKATVDLDVWGVVVKKAEVSIKDTFEARLTAIGKFEKKIPLAKIPVKFAGVVGGTINVDLKIGVEGNISILYTMDHSSSVNYEMFKTPKFTANLSNPNWTLEARVKVYAKLEPAFKFEIGPCVIASVGGNIGIEAMVKAVTEKPGCVDVTIYMPGALFVGAEREETLLGKLGIKYTHTFWSTDTSPLKKKFHLEDGQFVEECTFGKDKTAESTDESGLELPDKMNFDIYNENNTDYYVEHGDVDEVMQISSYYASMEEGWVDVLRVVTLPAEYDSSKIVFSSSDTRVADVDSQGRVTAKGQGSCQIKVATSDGKYVLYCTIAVSANYDVDFTPLEPMWYNEDETEEDNAWYTAIHLSHIRMSA